jgi:hypothetical protein
MKFKASLLALALLVGYENKPTPTEAPATNQVKASAEDEGPKTGPLTVKDFRLVASQNAYQTPGAPKPEALEAQIVLALNNSAGFQTAGGRKATGTATYEITVSEGKTEVMLFGGIKATGSDARGLKAEILVTDADTEDKSPDAVANEAVSRFVKRIAAQAEVEQASDVEIVGLLDSEDARLVAIQEIRDRRLRDTTPRLRELLSATDAQVRVSTAAALVAFEDTESYSNIIKVTEDFSRDRSPQLMPMIYVVADINTGEAKTYLQTLADAHPVEAVRKVAAEALAKKP